MPHPSRALCRPGALAGAAASLGVLLATCLGAPAMALPGDGQQPTGDGGSTCQPDDLSAYPVQTVFDYEAEIQPVWTNNCTGCHFPGNPEGSLVLEAGASYQALIGVPSAQSGAWIRVVPFDPAESLLFLKLNCANPPLGDRMPQFGMLDPALQARIHDWIAAGAPLLPVLFADGFEPAPGR